MKVLFTNNHILNLESIEKGKKIKLVYKGLIKEIEIIRLIMNIIIMIMK